MNRTDYIGASDIACVLNINPYKTAYQLWLEKTGKSSEELTASKESLFAYGKHMEPFIAEQYTLATDKKVYIDTDTIYQHHQHHFAACHIDAVIDVSHKDAVALLEIKTASYLTDAWGDEESDDMPLNYLAQCAWEAICYESAVGKQVQYVDLAVWVQGRLKIYTYVRNAEFENILIKAAINFWRCVDTLEMPSPLLLQDLKSIYKTSKDLSIAIADNNVIEKVEKLEKIKLMIKNLEKEADVLQAMICEKMGFNEQLNDIGGKKLATWKTCSTSRLDIIDLKKQHAEIYDKYLHTTTSRRFLLNKGK